jgi:RHS repeat-associated protein
LWLNFMAFETVPFNSPEYQWDHRNRLVAVTFKNNSGTVTKAVEYQYDANNLRIVKSVDADGTGSGGAVETRYVLDGQNVALALTGGALTSRYLQSFEMDRTLADEEIGDGLYYVAADHLGTVRHVIKQGVGTFHREYTAFGEIRNDGFPSNVAFAFTGAMFDAETGLQYQRARYFDPAAGRWISEDPIGFSAGDGNLSRYVGNATAVATDPSGLIIKSDCAIDKIFKKYGVSDFVSRSIERGGNNKGPYLYNAKAGTEPPFGNIAIRSYDKNELGIAKEILIKMTKDRNNTYYVSNDIDRYFKGNKDDKQAICDYNIQRHIDARLKIVELASKKVVKFGTGPVPKYNTQLTPEQNWNILNDPKNAIGCKDVTYAILRAATTRTSYDAFDPAIRPMGVWIPGDKAWIMNFAHQKNNPKADPSYPWKDGFEGENIIYVGNNLFWGHWVNNDNLPRPAASQAAGFVTAALPPLIDKTGWYKTKEEWSNELRDWFVSNKNDIKKDEVYGVPLWPGELKDMIENPNIVKFPRNGLTNLR